MIGGKISKKRGDQEKKMIERNKWEELYYNWKGLVFDKRKCQSVIGSFLITT